MSRSAPLAALELHPALHPVLTVLAPAPRAAVVPTRRERNPVLDRVMADNPIKVVSRPDGWWVVGEIALYLAASRCLRPEHSVAIRAVRKELSEAAIQAEFLQERLRLAVSGEMAVDGLLNLFETARAFHARLGSEHIPPFSLSDLAVAANKAPSSLRRRA